MNKGFVKIWRKIEVSGLLDNAEVCRLFLWLMIKASSRERKQLYGTEYVELFPGQIIVGRHRLAADLGTTERKIRTGLASLQKMGVVSLRPTNKFTIVSLVNWGRYQNRNDALDPQVTCARPQDDRLVTTKQESKQVRSSCSLQQTADAASGCEQQTTAQATFQGAPTAVSTFGPQPGLCANQPHTAVNERSPSLHSLPLSDGTVYTACDPQLRHLHQLYPNVDIDQQLRTMRGWLESHPTRRKTQQGILKFIHGWLAKEQNALRAHAAPRNAPPTATTQYQKQRQDRENLAKFILAAEKEMSHGDNAANHNGNQHDGFAVQGADERGGVASHGRDMADALS